MKINIKKMTIKELEEDIKTTRISLFLFFFLAMMIGIAIIYTERMYLITTQMLLLTMVIGDLINLKYFGIIYRIKKKLI